MLRAEKTQSITFFLQNHKKVIQKLKKSGRPMVLTNHGRPEIVVHDMASYPSIADALDRMEAVEGIRRGLEAMRKGQHKPAATVFKELRKKFGVPRTARK